jgi:hypothetical protein
VEEENSALLFQKNGIVIFAGIIVGNVPVLLQIPRRTQILSNIPEKMVVFGSALDNGTAQNAHQDPA